MVMSWLAFRTGPFEDAGIGGPPLEDHPQRSGVTDGRFRTHYLPPPGG